MITFHGKQEIKDKYLARVIKHQKADNLTRGIGWEDGKGCAVGCTLEDYDHSKYESELGIPEWLARVEDALFEGMCFEKSKTWPEKFLMAANVGSDLDRTKTPFLILILERNIRSLDECSFDKESNPEVAKAVDQSRVVLSEMIRCHQNGLDMSAAWSAARSAARSAESAAWSAESAASAVWSAARSAESAARSAESAVWSAESAASAVWSAARSAASAAWSAARSAESAARSAARSAAFDYFADELLKLMMECK